jgi:CheY-like chemotaxis protein
MLEGATVLLVEDDPAIVEIVCLGLSYEGAEVVVARDGVQAVQRQRDAAPDLVLLDLMLPRLDGMEVLEHIRAQGDTPVIVLTARDRLEDRVGGLEAGADDYVTKESSSVVSSGSATRRMVATSRLSRSTTVASRRQGSRKMPPDSTPESRIASTWSNHG